MSAAILPLPDQAAPASGGPAVMHLPLGKPIGIPNRGHFAFIYSRLTIQPCFQTTH